ncbi:MAG TPA: Gfo/Idh/MocA family oxidoreductase [Alphaproteobacteria bacterium]|nr:Gfo/Idh/MocA family oxidoreductase [Alphaproteobacteria bacterium]
MSRYRTALIGAGFISTSHIEALKAGVPDAEITAIVDRNQALADAQARRWGISRTFGNVDDLIGAGVADVAHVMVPPDAHAAVARQLLEAGLHVLLEKPMSTSAADCDDLAALAAAKGKVLGVNQNFVYHPTYRIARRILLDERRLGPIRSLHVTFNVPLRQLAAGQFGHWMFRRPVNILLEQAVHPLSQMVDLLGPPTRTEGRPETPLLLAPGKPFHDRWLADFAFGDKVAQLYLAFGQSYHAWRFTAICDDGLLTCDLSAGRVMVQGRAQWPEFLDNLVTGTGMAAGIAGQSVGGAIGYLTGLLKLRPRSDGFFVSMRESIAGFYRGLDMGKAPIDSAFGAGLVRICEFLAQKAAPPATQTAPKPGAVARPELVVFGGTGFIGSHLVAKLVAEGRAVRVVSRGADAARPPFDSPLVEVMRGDVANRADVERAMQGMKQAVNLAHGGGGADWAEIKRTMVESAVMVGECAVAAGVERLVHVGSIAGLYLGDPTETVTGATPPDPDSSRALYARGKAEADRALKRFADEKTLELVLLRPGLVVGKGTPAVHGGLGFFNNEQHVIGWNAGLNALPFVLVEDVADAIIRALAAPEAAGKAYNLVGDVRPNAREFVAALAQATGRPITFHPQSVDWLYAAELFKWGLKRGTGKKVDAPSRRDLLSRGLRARIDCEDAKRDLGWRPVSDQAAFFAAAVDVHRAPFARAE